ncbi:MAG: LamG-like jellyroll fold domain-containing protein [archaeon]
MVDNMKNKTEIISNKKILFSIIIIAMMTVLFLPKLYAGTFNPVKDAYLFWDFSNNAKDISGNGNDGSLADGSIGKENYIISKDLWFLNNVYVNKYYKSTKEINGHINSNSSKYSGNFTLSFWVNFTSNTDIEFKSSNFYLAVFSESRGMYIGSNIEENEKINSNLTNNKWQNITFVYVKDLKQISIFVDGQQVGEPVVSDLFINLIIPNSISISSGISKIDNFAVYTRVLDKDKIEYIYNNTKLNVNLKDKKIVESLNYSLIDKAPVNTPPAPTPGSQSATLTNVTLPPNDKLDLTNATDKLKFKIMLNNMAVGNYTGKLAIYDASGVEKAKRTVNISADVKAYINIIPADADIATLAIGTYTVKYIQAAMVSNIETFTIIKGGTPILPPVTPGSKSATLTNESGLKSQINLNITGDNIKYKATIVGFATGVANSGSFIIREVGTQKGPGIPFTIPAYSSSGVYTLDTTLLNARITAGQLAIGGNYTIEFAISGVTSNAIAFTIIKGGTPIIPGTKSISLKNITAPPKSTIDITNTSDKLDFKVDLINYAKGNYNGFLKIYDGSTVKMTIPLNIISDTKKNYTLISTDVKTAGLVAGNYTMKYHLGTEVSNDTPIVVVDGSSGTKQIILTNLDTPKVDIDLNKTADQIGYNIELVGFNISSINNGEIKFRNTSGTELIKIAVNIPSGSNKLVYNLISSYVKTTGKFTAGNSYTIEYISGGITSSKLTFNVIDLGSGIIVPIPTPGGIMFTLMYLGTECPATAEPPYCTTLPEWKSLAKKDGINFELVARRLLVPSGSVELTNADNCVFRQEYCAVPLDVNGCKKADKRFAVLSDITSPPTNSCHITFKSTELKDNLMYLILDVNGTKVIQSIPARINELPPVTPPLVTTPTIEDLTIVEVDKEDGSTIEYVDGSYGTLFELPTGTKKIKLKIAGIDSKANNSLSLVTLDKRYENIFNKTEFNKIDDKKLLPIELPYLNNTVIQLNSRYIIKPINSSTIELSLNGLESLTKPIVIEIAQYKKDVGANDLADGVNSKNISGNFLENINEEADYIIILPPKVDNRSQTEKTKEILLKINNKVLENIYYKPELETAISSSVTSSLTEPSLKKLFDETKK